VIYRTRDILGSSDVIIEAAPEYVFEVPVQKVKCGDCVCFRDLDWTPEQGCGRWGTVND